MKRQLMRWKYVQLAIGVSLLGGAPVAVCDDWQVNGFNTLRLETYDSDGAMAASPYPFNGGQYYNEFNLNFSKRESPYARWVGQMYGVFNSSDYRSSETGFVPEKLSLMREKGDADLPYRLHVGDYYGYFSYLTLQNSLKGAQLELQPSVDADGGRHSIVLLVGENDSQWKGIDPGDDLTAGISWLIEDQRWGVLNFNLVSNQRNGDTGVATLDRDQTVVSAAILKQYDFSLQSLSIEGELAYMRGDHNGITSAASGQSQNGTGAFIELTGQHHQLPLDYRFRTDFYDQDFQPAGAVTISDRRSTEMHGGWFFDSGLRLRGRAQYFEDDVDSANPTNTYTLGANLGGALGAIGLSGVQGSVDGYYQTVQDDNRSTDQYVQALNANVSKNLPDDWLGRVSLYAQHLEDDSVTDADSQTYQVTVDGSHPVALLGFNGTIVPGASLRVVKDSGETTDWGPTLALFLNRGAHGVRFNYNFLAENTQLAGVSDVNTHSLSMDYRYQTDINTLGVEVELFDREPSPGADTDAYAVRLFWTFYFDNQPYTPSARAGAGQTSDYSRQVAADISELAPGLLLRDAEIALRKQGSARPILLSNLQVYEYPLLTAIDQRQRVIFSHTGQQLHYSALIIEFDDIGNTATIAQTYHRVRSELIKRYGPPSVTFEEGRFSKSIVSNINTGSLLRVDEWPTQQGTLRFGIPRRLDGQVRMELQHRRSFSNPRDTLWSVEQVR